MPVDPRGAENSNFHLGSDWIGDSLANGIRALKPGNHAGECFPQQGGRLMDKPWRGQDEFDLLRIYLSKDPDRLVQRMLQRCHLPAVLQNQLNNSNRYLRLQIVLQFDYKAYPVPAGIQ